MCGIVGVVALNNSGVTFKDREIFQDMLITDSLRGKDGTGAIIADAGGGCRVLKKVGHPFALLGDKQWKNFFDPAYDAKRPKDLVLIGHNRWASGGYAVSTDNSHPHVADHITLVHNGTLASHSKLPGMNKMGVDSAALADGIAKLGIDEAISKAYGSYAIVYVDREEGTINFLRNDQRPLYFATEEDHSRMFFGSEPGMLKWILARRNIKSDGMAQLKPNVLMSFRIEENTARRMPESTTRVVEGPPIQQYYRPNNYHDFIEDSYSPILRPYTEGRSRSWSPPSPKAVKKEEKVQTRILKSLKSMGVQTEVVKVFDNVRMGDTVVARLADFTESAESGKFTMTATSPIHPEAEFRFQVNGMHRVEKLMEEPIRVAMVRRIIKVPDAKAPDPRFLVWVSDEGPLEGDPKAKKSKGEPAVPDMAAVTKFSEPSPDCCGMGCGKPECGSHIVEDINAELREAMADGPTDRAWCCRGGCAGTKIGEQCNTPIKGLPKSPTEVVEKPPHVYKDDLPAIKAGLAVIAGVRPVLSVVPKTHRQEVAALLRGSVLDDIEKRTAKGDAVYQDPDVQDRILH